MESEQDRIRRIIENMAKGDDIGNKLIYDRVAKKVRPTSGREDPDSVIEITPEDATLYCKKQDEK